MSSPLAPAIVVVVPVSLRLFHLGPPSSSLSGLVLVLVPVVPSSSPPVILRHPPIPLVRRRGVELRTIRRGDPLFRRSMGVNAEHVITRTTPPGTVSPDAQLSLLTIPSYECILCLSLRFASTLLPLALSTYDLCVHPSRFWCCRGEV